MMKKYFMLLCTFLPLLTSCGSEAPQDVAKDVSKDIEQKVGGLVGEINSQILSEVRKKYPLPDPVTIRNAHNDKVTVTTSLNVENVVSFYRQAYEEKHFTEVEGSTGSGDAARLGFRDPADGKTVRVQIEKRGSETEIKLEKS